MELRPFVDTFISVCCVIVSLSFSGQTAADHKLDFLFYLSLEELLQLEVTVASKGFETLADAPGMVTVYSPKDLERTGYYTLADLANITPGYGTYSLFGEKVFETRGQKATGFDNNRHLLLIDGIPVHHARSYKVQTEEELPLFFASKIEFLRGPGSVLYGTGALYGVVSITPQTKEEIGFSVDQKISIGGPDSPRRLMGNIFNTTESTQTRVSLGYFTKDPSKEITGDNVASERYYDDQESYFAYLKHQVMIESFGELGFGLILTDKRGGQGESTISNFSSELNRQQWQTIIPYLKYKTILPAEWELGSFIKYNKSVELGISVFDPSTFGNTGLRFLDFRIEVENWEAQLELKKTFSNDSSLIFGMNYDQRKELGTPDSHSDTIRSDQANTIRNLETSERFEIYSAYAQYQREFNILKGLIITAGVRYDLGKAGSFQKYEHISPRVAFVQRLRDDFNLKLLYGSAFITPGIREVGRNSGIEDRDPGAGLTSVLKPQIFENVELGAVYHNSRLIWEGALFYNETTDILGTVRKIRPNGTATFPFENISGVTRAYGFETAITYTPLNSLGLSVNYAYANTRDVDGNDVEDAPRQKLNFMATHVLQKPIPMSNTLVVRWVDGFRTAENGGLIDGFTLVDWNITAKLSRKIKAGVTIRNLFNKKDFLPRRGEDNVPLPGINFLTTLSVGF